MLAEPVPPALALLNVLSDATSVVNTFVTVALILPVVNVTGARMIAVDGALHCNEESDIHTVLSLVVSPKLTVLVYSINPKFTP